MTSSRSECRAAFSGYDTKASDGIASSQLDDALAYLGAIKGSGKVLDLGCGEGDHFPRYAAVGQPCYGIDLSAERLLLARARFPDACLVRGDVHRLPWSDGQFDGLFCASVLQYVDHPVVIRECARVVRPGGRVVFVEQLAGHPLAWLYRKARRAIAWQYPPYQTPRGHLRYSELSSFLDVFSQVDFRFYELLSPALNSLSVLRSALKRSSGYIEVASPYRGRLAPVTRALKRFDRRLLDRFPWARRNAWVVNVFALR